MSHNEHTHQHNPDSGTVLVAENPTPASVIPTHTKPDIEYEVNEFEDGDWKGFKFTAPVYNSLTAAEAIFGTEKVLALLNTQINSRIRTKVKNGLPKGLKPTELATKQAELIAKNQGLLFSQDEASSWRPEVRELSPNQMFKQAKEMFAQAGKETDPAKKMELLAKGQQLLMDMSKVLTA